MMYSRGTSSNFLFVFSAYATDTDRTTTRGGETCKKVSHINQKKSDY